MQRTRISRTATALTAMLLAGCGEPAEPSEGTEGGGGVPHLSEVAPDAAVVPGGRAARGPEAPAPGSWHRARPAELTRDQAEEIDRLSAIGYARGSVEATDERGVTVHDPRRACAGFNAYVSGHGPEAVLIDMEGAVLHRWRCEYARAWPERAGSEEAQRVSAQHWRRAHVFPNGDLLAIFAGIGLIKLDRDSELLWAADVGAHHDLEVVPNGRIYVLTRTAHVVPRVNAGEPILEDFISILDEDGNEERRVSVLECLERSRFATLWPRNYDRGYIFHTNTLSVLDGRLSATLPSLRRGNVLTSMRTLDAIAVVDLERERVVWAKRGPFAGQHDPQVLDSGNLLLFDNYGLRGRSRVLELDPASGEIVWQYAGSPERPFYSRYNGTTSRLPNGNTLIVESNTGRAFEVTRQLDVVWEWHSPHVAGDNGEFVATLFDLIRLPADFPVDWCQR